MLACSGSLPPGAPVDGYARLAARAAAAGRPVVVDANGPTLRAALDAGVDVVTPNLGEAEGLLHGRAEESVDAEADARPRALAAARELAGRGARAAVVTAAAAGAAVADGGAAPVWLVAARATARNPVGAGDVLVAGLAAGLERGEPLLEAVRRGMAAAAASVETPRAGNLDPARMRALLAAVTLDSEERTP